MIRLKKPKVIIVNGNASILSMGLINEFKRPKTKAITAVVKRFWDDTPEKTCTTTSSEIALINQLSKNHSIPTPP
jgi:hypothetical protein